MRDPPARQRRVFLRPHEKGSCEPPQTSMQDLHGILAGIVWKLMQGIHARSPNQTRFEALVALGALGCVVSVYVSSLNDAIKCSALDVWLASRTLGPHFRPHLLTVTAAKSNGLVEDRGLGMELTFSWVGTATLDLYSTISQQISLSHCRDVGIH